MNGRDYYLVREGLPGRRLNEGLYSTSGTSEDQAAARQKAVDILAVESPELVEEAKTRKFEWNGYM
jgi:hypothetical protein